MSAKYNQEGFNVKDYGAVGDGVTDDSAAIQACFDASIGSDFAVGRKIFFPKGKYKLGTTLYVRRHLNIVGETAGGFFTAVQLLPAKNISAIQVDFENLVTAPERRGGSSIIENIKIVYTAGSTVWQKSTAYSLGALVVSQPGYSDYAGQAADPKVSNFYVMECTTAGTSGTSTPNWDATTPLTNGQGSLSFAEGATISDGGVTWTVRVLAGVRMHAGAFLKNVWVEGCAGNGFLVAASVGWNPYSNVNNFDIDICQASSNGLHGLFVQGSDANAGNIRNFLAIENRRWGLYDHSFLGNSYIGCNASTNGDRRGITSITRNSAGTVTVVMQKEHGLVVGQPIRQWNDPDVNFPRNEHTVVAVPDDFTFTYTQGGPATTGLTTIEFLIGGGAYKAYDYNAANVFVGCYSEGDQYPSEITSPSVVTGGLHAASFSDLSTAGIQNGPSFLTPHGSTFKDLRQSSNPTGVTVNVGGGRTALNITSDQEGPVLTVSSLTRVSGVVTVVTSSAHGFSIDQKRYLTAINDGNFSGGLKLIHEVLSPTSFTYLESGADASGIAGHYFLNGGNTGFALADDGPTGFEGWWLWRHANLDARVLMAWSGQLAAAGPGRVWFPQGLILGGQGAYQNTLEFSSTDPSSWATPIQNRGSLRIEAQTYPQAGLVHGIFGYQFINDGIGTGTQILRWPHFGKDNQIDVTSTPYATDWKKHAGVVFTNDGASGLINFTLQSSNGFPDLRGTEYTFFVKDAVGIRITAYATMKLRWGVDVTADGGYLESTTAGSWLKIKLAGTVASPQWQVVEAMGTWTDGTNTFHGVGGAGGGGAVEDETGDITLVDGDSGKTYTNYGASGMITITAPASPSAGFLVKLRCVVAQTLNFELPTGHTLYVDDAISTTASGTIYTITIGSSCTLQYLGNNIWVAESIAGTWTTT